MPSIYAHLAHLDPDIVFADEEGCPSDSSGSYSCSDPQCDYSGCMGNHTYSPRNPWINHFGSRSPSLSGEDEKLIVVGDLRVEDSEIEPPSGDGAIPSHPVVAEAPSHPVVPLVVSPAAELELEAEAPFDVDAFEFSDSEGYVGDDECDGVHHMEVSDSENESPMEGLCKLSFNDPLLRCPPTV